MAKISIIVPIYNVEKYLEKCLDSIVQQTYKNIEVILIDDGSYDQCGKICDRYQQKDTRIKVIHMGNNGVSSARNTGLKIATGEWIGWVDADDWIENDMFEYLIKNASKYNADVAVCGRWEEYEQKSLFRGWREAERLDSTQAIKQLLENDSLQNYLWDKLWKRELFNDIIFPHGKTFEDVAVVYQLLDKANSVICLPDGKYHYTQRMSSIVNDFSIANKINYYMAIKQRHIFISEKYPQLLKESLEEIAVAVIRIWSMYYDDDNIERKEVRNELNHISEFMKSNNFSIYNFDTRLGIIGRIILRLTPYTTWWAFTGAKILSSLYEIKHGRHL